MTIIDLSISSSGLSENELSDITSTDLKEIIDGLNGGDPILSSGELLTFLDKFNQSKLKYVSRYGVLENLRPVILDTYKTLLEKYQSATFPLSANQQDCAKVVLQLLRSLSNGYKVIVLELVADLDNGADAEKISLPLKLGIQRSILYLGMLLMETYRMYLSEPKDIWRDLHQLYQFAEENHLHTLPVKKEHREPELGLSIKQVYMRILLLSLFNPYHLVKGEVALIYERAGRWSNFVRLEKHNKKEGCTEKFMVNLDLNDSPYYLFSDSLDTQPPDNCRVLEISSLVQVLENQIKAVDENINKVGKKSSAIEKEQRDMYLRLKNSLFPRKERSTPRIPVSEKLRVVDGLIACHYFLNEEQPFFENEDLSGELLQGVTNGDEIPDAPVSWNQINESEDGIALFCDQRSDMKISNGQLVAFHIDNDTDRWSVGVIRWLQNNRNGKTEFGVQVIANTAQAVGLKIVRGVSDNMGLVRGIVTPDVDPLKEVATIIATPKVFDVGMVILINLENRIINVKLHELIEATGFYERYSFIALHETPKK